MSFSACASVPGWALPRGESQGTREEKMMGSYEIWRTEESEGFWVV